MKVDILKDYDHRPTPASVTAFKAKTTVEVNDALGADLIKEGVAKKNTTPEPKE